MQIGDGFIKGGFPGMLLSFWAWPTTIVPARGFFFWHGATHACAGYPHHEKNPTNASLSPWYKRYRWAIRWVHQNGFLRSSIWNALLRKMSKTKNELYGFQANSNPKVILVLDSWCKQHSWQRKKGGQCKPLDPIPLNRRHKDYLMTGIKNEV